MSNTDIEYGNALLTEKLNANTQEIKDTLKANEAELVKEEENKETLFESEAYSVCQKCAVVQL